MTAKNETSSIVDRIYSDLKKDIIQNIYLPNEILTETHIATHYKISKTRVHEAVRRLQIEKLLIAVPKTGFQVTPISYEEVRENFEVRKALEILAVKRAIFHISESEGEELKALVNHYLKYATNEYSFANLDATVHQKIWTISKNKALFFHLKQIEENEHRLWFYANKTSSNLTFSEITSNDNTLNKLVTAIIDKDMVAAMMAIHEHLDYYAEQLHSTMEHSL